MSETSDLPERVNAAMKVASVKDTMEWYRLVGFDLRGAFPDDEPTWAEVGRDGLVLQLLSGETPWEGDPSFTGTFYVHPPSVRQVHEEVQGKVPAEWGVEERPWGAVELTLRDPNGYFITFTE